MKAVLLSAGQGTRLGELTQKLPKPLLSIGGKSLLEHQIAHLKRDGFLEVAINLHWQSDLIRTHLGNGKHLGVNITYFEEPTLLGTGGALRAMGNWLSDSTLVIYADVLTKLDYRELVKQHELTNADATLCVHRRSKSNSYVVVGDNHRILNFLERPELLPHSNENWVNSGIQIIKNDILEKLPSGFSDLPKNLYEPFYSSLDLRAFFYEGDRVAIDSPQRYEQAKKIFNSEFQ